jgi:hypothetical protein
VSIGASDTEGAHAHHCDVCTWKVRAGLRDYDAQSMLFKHLVRLITMQARGYSAVLQHQGQLDKASDACGRLHVTNLRLETAHRQRSISRTAEHIRNGRQFDGVAESCPGAVCLEVHRLIQGRTGVSVRIAELAALGWVQSGRLCARLGSRQNRE